MSRAHFLDSLQYTQNFPLKLPHLKFFPPHIGFIELQLKQHVYQGRFIFKP